MEVPVTFAPEGDSKAGAAPLPNELFPAEDDSDKESRTTDVESGLGGPKKKLPFSLCRKPSQGIASHAKLVMFA